MLSSMLGGEAINLVAPWGPQKANVSAWKYHEYMLKALQAVPMIADLPIAMRWPFVSVKTAHIHDALQDLAFHQARKIES